MLKLDKKQIAKWAAPALGGLFLLAIALIGIQILFPPKSGIDTPASNPNTNGYGEALDLTSLQVKALESKMTTAEENIKRMYANQVKLNESIASLLKEDENIRKVLKENRAYVALLYQKSLDLELQVQSLGGGFNVKPSKLKEDPINPLIGTDVLPPNNP